MAIRDKYSNLIDKVNVEIAVEANKNKHKSNIASSLFKQLGQRNGMKVNQSIINEIDNNFSREALYSLAKLIKLFVEKNEVWLDEQVTNLPYYMLVAEKSEMVKLSKAQLVYATCVIFSESLIFRKFYDGLDSDKQIVFTELAWNSKVEGEELNQKLSEPIVTRKGSSYYANYDINSDYSFLPARNSWDSPTFFYLPTAIKKVVALSLDKPANYVLRSIKDEDISASLMRWDEGETLIFDEVQKLLAYHLQGQIAVNQSGKISATVAKKMRKLLAIKEFYADSTEQMGLLRTNLLAQLISTFEVKSKKLVSLDSAGIIKELFQKFKGEHVSLFILNDFKGHSAMSLYNYSQVFENFMINFLRNELPKQDWVAVSNIVDYIYLHDMGIENAFNTGDIYSLWYDTKTERYSTRVTMKPTQFRRMVYTPVIKGTFYLFASLGFVDIVYGPPPAGEMGKDYDSSYDALQYVRLTDLGKYVFGLTQEYTPKVNKHTQGLVFDDKSLLIFCDPENTVAEVILANYAERVSPTRFRVTNEVFLKDCKTTKQLVSKIDLFRKSIAPNLPPNWASFFDELLSKASPLKPVSNLHVFSIPESNKELMRLLVQDPVLKSMCIKAEGFRILVAEKSVPELKKRLKTFGYLVD